MPRRRARGTPYLSEHTLQELYPRLGLDEVARSTSTAPHNRRKPTVGGVGTEEMADAAATNPKIADGAVGNVKVADGAITSPKVNDSIKNPGQGTTCLRTIGNFLGGSSVQASAGDHSHGSGNSSDFDLLPLSHQRRILLARQRVRNSLRNLGTLTDAQLRLFLRELSIVALGALSLEIDAPDLTAEQRRARRDAGEDLPLFSEWRLPSNGPNTKPLHDSSHVRYQEGLPNEGTVPE
jgi:hypothetical protein